ncbi:porin family protein [Aquimarina sp. U1-2]|uniref:outer membrane beta-barrel protein n=1 Tax=Aquimarina sp. U1-2 TaxID=2823141 RepID=UPI001AEC8695|nr:outer membrane beta-barrel protein [Aquimarina sp. U1-2]MBP2833534.1 porin family protein [Aquimarina sp. U1-2]
MKKVMLTAMAVVSFVTAKAQDAIGSEGFANGDVFISGAVGYGSTKTGDTKSNTLTLTPRVGYFVDSNFVIGLRAGYVSESLENTVIEDTFVEELDINTLEIGGFGRYYSTPADKFSFFGELAISYLSTDTDFGTGDFKTDGFGIGFSPGINYFLSPNIAIEAAWGALSYVTVEPDFEGAESTDTFEIGLDLDDITLGLVYKF